jgi:MoxR-vWA-beta-propeller ternary system domain bpX4
MSSFVPFLERLFAEGKVVLRDRPRPGPGRRRDEVDLLARTYAAYRLEVAGPPVEFDAGAALAAAGLLARACWFLVSRAEPPEELERSLVMPGPPASAAQHLSADLVLRYLPQVYRRARALAPDDTLTAALARVLRQWPLSGVLSDVEEGPTTPPEFDGHPGLMLLYAERLADRDKPAWLPRGRPREYVELVYSGLGKTVRAAE